MAECSLVKWSKSLGCYMVLKQSTPMDIENFCDGILSCCCCYNEDSSLVHNNTRIVGTIIILLLYMNIYVSILLLLFYCITTR